MQSIPDDTSSPLDASDLPHPHRPPSMTMVVLAVFVLVYLGMILGGLPYLQLDRTGVALLGAIAMVGMGALTPEQAAAAVHLPTLLLLFAFMVVSAQLRLGGFYAWITRRIARLPLSPPRLLAALIAVVAVLAAIFSNDIVCLAAAPVLADACIRRGLNPVPFLLALACAANVGSAATLIGNPQNMLIGATLQLDFGAYFVQVLPVVLPSLMVTWAIIVWCSKSRWMLEIFPGEMAAGDRHVTGEEFDGWQTAKGLSIAAVLIMLFLATDIPREIAALVGAGVLLSSRRLHSSKTLELVDWELLVLFIGLFIVNRALETTGLVQAGIAEAADRGIALDHPAFLFVAGSVLSNIVSNVPAVMLLLPLATHEQAGPLLAVVTTLAGNLLIVGSIANIIVVDAAKRCGIDIDWRVHARIGVPVTLSTLVLAGLWFAFVLTPVD
jgi:Na+/H+ antiporter NhaD/arsenite permease-like protein